MCLLAWCRCYLTNVEPWHLEHLLNKIRYKRTNGSQLDCNNCLQKSRIQTILTCDDKYFKRIFLEIICRYPQVTKRLDNSTSYWWLNPVNGLRGKWLFTFVVLLHIERWAYWEFIYQLQNLFKEKQIIY